jgi:hypothetical protein
MFVYPKQAELIRSVPKTKIYAYARVGKRIKEGFASQIGEILWKYKLSPETINLPARNGIQEIQVFELKLRTPELDEALLQVIDKAIPFPLLFELVYDDQVSFAASYKRPSAADSQKWVIEARFRTKPQSTSAPRQPLPVALDLAGLYEQIIRKHIPLQARSDESLAEQMARFTEFETKRKTELQLQAQLAQEKQFRAL